MAEAVNALYKTELHRNPAALAANGGHWRGLDDLEIATCRWVAWSRYAGDPWGLLPDQSGWVTWPSLRVSFDRPAMAVN